MTCTMEPLTSVTFFFTVVPFSCSDVLGEGPTPARGTKAGRAPPHFRRPLTTSPEFPLLPPDAGARLAIISPRLGENTGSQIAPRCITSISQAGQPVTMSEHLSFSTRRNHASRQNE